MAFVNNLISIITLLLLFILPSRDVTLLFFKFQLNSLKLLLFMLLVCFTNFLFIQIFGKIKLEYSQLKVLYIISIVGFGLIILYIYAINFLTDVFITLPRRYIALNNARDPEGASILYPYLFIICLILFLVLNIYSLIILSSSSRVK